jgi:hypothetical protein
MAWATPRTWTPGETVTAALLNAHLRDNLNVLKTYVTDGGYPRCLAGSFGSSGDGAANSGTNETPIWAVNLEAGLIDANSKGVRLSGSIVVANNANTKTLRIDIAGQKYLILQNAAAVANNRWVFDLWIVRSTGADIASVNGLITYGAASGATPTLAHHGAGAITAIDFGIAQTLSLTAQSSGAGGDLVFYGVVAQWLL